MKRNRKKRDFQARPGKVRGNGEIIEDISNQESGKSRHLSVATRWFMQRAWLALNDNTHALSALFSFGDGGCNRGCYQSNNMRSPKMLLKTKILQTPESFRHQTCVLHSNNSAPLVRVLTGVLKENKGRGDLRSSVLFQATPKKNAWSQVKAAEAPQ